VSQMRGKGGTAPCQPLRCLAPARPVRGVRGPVRVSESRSPRLTTAVFSLVGDGIFAVSREQFVDPGCETTTRQFVKDVRDIGFGVKPV
jgi:hypothetical protein